MKKNILVIAALAAMFLACELPTFVTYSNDTGGTAAAGETTDFELVISGGGSEMVSVDEVKITNIDFAYIDDLTIHIISPAGTAMAVVQTDSIRHFDGTYTFVGSSARGDYPSLEDADQVTDNSKPWNTIQSGEVMQAAQSFGGAEGQNPNGTWILRITNDHSYRDCTLEGFSLTYGKI